MSQSKAREIINAFKDNRTEILSNLYLETYPLIQRFVKSNSGTDDDAKDILQEAFLIILTKVRNDTMRLSCSFNTYIYSICRNLWLKHLRNSRNFNVKIVDVAQIVDYNYYVDFEKEFTLNEQYFTYRTHFHSLSQICKDILSLFLQKKSFVEIADELNLINDEYARKKKYRCKEVLIKRIKSDPNFNALIE